MIRKGCSLLFLRFARARQVINSNPAQITDHQYKKVISHSENSL